VINISYVDRKLERRIEFLDYLISISKKTILKARKERTVHILEGAQQELILAEYEKEKALKELMGRDY